MQSKKNLKEKIQESALILDTSYENPFDVQCNSESSNYECDLAW